MPTKVACTLSPLQCTPSLMNTIWKFTYDLVVGMRFHVHIVLIITRPLLHRVVDEYSTIVHLVFALINFLQCIHEVLVRVLPFKRYITTLWCTNELGSTSDQTIGLCTCSLKCAGFGEAKNKICSISKMSESTYVGSHCAVYVWLFEQEKILYSTKLLN